MKVLVFEKSLKCLIDLNTVLIKNDKYLEVELAQSLKEGVIKLMRNKYDVIFLGLLKVFNEHELEIHFDLFQRVTKAPIVIISHRKMELPYIQKAFKVGYSDYMDNDDITEKIIKRVYKRMLR